MLLFKKCSEIHNISVLTFCKTEHFFFYDYFLVVMTILAPSDYLALTLILSSVVADIFTCEDL